MLKSKLLLAALVAALGAAAATSATADEKTKPKRGGYSYSPEDTINTYGDARTKYGSTSTFRDPKIDRQTNAGPFDHGFFFDSAMGRNGGDSPYMN